MYKIKGFSTKKDLKKQFKDNNVPLISAFSFENGKADNTTLDGLDLRNKKDIKQDIIIK